MLRNYSRMKNFFNEYKSNNNDLSYDKSIQKISKDGFISQMQVGNNYNHINITDENPI